MSLSSNHMGGQCPSNPPTLRDKLIAGGVLVSFFWFVTWLTNHLGFIPFVPWILAALATLVTAATGFGILGDIRRVKR